MQVPLPIPLANLFALGEEGRMEGEESAGRGEARYRSAAPGKGGRRCFSRGSPHFFHPPQDSPSPFSAQIGKRIGFPSVSGTAGHRTRLGHLLSKGSGRCPSTERVYPLVLALVSFGKPRLVIERQMCPVPCEYAQTLGQDGPLEFGTRQSFRCPHLGGQRLEIHFGANGIRLDVLPS